MADSESQRRYRQDAVVLGEIGWHLVRSELPMVQVRLPRSLAEKAVAAWERDEDTGPLNTEDLEQRTQRHRAATLALIGLSIVKGGVWDRDEVVVPVSPEVIGISVDASDALPPREP